MGRHPHFVFSPFRRRWSFFVSIPHVPAGTYVIVAHASASTDESCAKRNAKVAGAARNSQKARNSSASDGRAPVICSRKTGAETQRGAPPGVWTDGTVEICRVAAVAGE